MKKKNIKFSLVAPAIRIENWLKVYDTMKSENTNFEVIFAGPRKPNFNFHQILDLFLLQLNQHNAGKFYMKIVMESILLILVMM